MNDKQKIETISNLNNIVVHGAREHNLKNINLVIPRDELVVITGLSGSGKSSLAFDTLYAEGQRRYVECLSSYARQMLGILKKPDIDTIDGLSPAISIEQKSISHNPRSTIGTVTEIYDYLRLLYARAGIQYCVECNIPVEQKSLDQITNEIIDTYKHRKIQILSPLVKARKGHYRELFEQLLRLGFTKVRVDGIIQDIVDDMQLSRYVIHDIDLLIDRINVEESQSQRISESVDLALKKGDNSMILLFEDSLGNWKEKFFSSSYSCPSCSQSYPTLAPNMFSFNSPYGACSKCDGLGELNDFNLALIIPDTKKSIAEGGIAILGKERERWLWNQVEAYCEAVKIDIHSPIEEIKPEKLQKLLFGSVEGEEVSISYNFKAGDNLAYKHKYIGLLPSFKHQYENTSSASIRRNVELFMTNDKCPDCKGGRLKESNLFVRVADKNINEITKLDISKAYNYFSNLHESLTERQNLIANLIIKEIKSRLGFLSDVGLSYLSLDRTIRTLSGGESQRIRLASQIGSELVGIMYVLDEPSIGLHQHDNQKLIDSLKKLRDLGNSVIVVEHDKAMIEQSDYIVDLGPGAGVHGGELIFSSQPSELKNIGPEQLARSLTAQYMLNKKEIEYVKAKRKPNGSFLTLKGANGNNLKNIDLKLPLGLMICISGMSGSGKSSLINDTLYPILSKHFFRSIQVPLPYDSIEGIDLIDKVIEIDQSPIGRTPRSNPATYTGIFTQIRDFFSMLPEAQIRGYKAGRFSFNVPGGRCEECEGGGIKKIEMNFLPDVYVTCDSCNGDRYNNETLSVLYRGKSIANVLDMTVEEALDFFKEIPKLKSKLQTLFDVGLGYIKLGQQAPTLSGGEAQRVKLATELSKVSTGKTLYLLDEPTTGLHFEDINILLTLLQKLVDKGNTIIIVEHNLDVIKCADWIIDLGPEGGDSGGYIIAEGTPEAIARSKKSFTGQYLRKELKK